MKTAMMVMTILPMILVHFMLATGLPQNGHSPVLIFPGLLQSQLEYGDDDRIMWYNEFNLYMLRKNYEKQFPTLFMDWSQQEGFTSYKELNIRAKGFGTIDGIEEIINGQHIIDIKLEGVKNITDFLIKKLEYTKNDDVCGAPYDWRFGANGLAAKQLNYFDEVKKQIEAMRERCKRPVTLICISMGCSLSHYFLTQHIGEADQDWKDENIHGYVTLVGGWSGGASALEAILKGYSKNPGLKLELDNMESLYWLLPRKEIWGDKPIASFNDEEYTTEDYEKFFKDIGKSESWSKLEQALNVLGDPLTSSSYAAPNVPTYCLYVVTENGDGVEAKETPEKLLLSLDAVVMGPGDGIITKLESEVCLKWEQEMPNEHFESKRCGGTHTNIECPEDDSVLDLIEKVVINPRPIKKDRGFSISNNFESLVKALGAIKPDVSQDKPIFEDKKEMISKENASREELNVFKQILKMLIE